MQLVKKRPKMILLYFSGCLRYLMDIMAENRAFCFFSCFLETIFITPKSAPSNFIPVVSTEGNTL